jgi:hypothetical protein
MRVAATVEDIHATRLFYKVEGDNVIPLAPISDLEGRIVIRCTLALSDFEIVDRALIHGKLVSGRFLQVADLQNPSPKTIWRYEQ